MTNRLEAALLHVVEVLERHGVGYAVTGSFALAYHGVVRATADVDVKVVAADFAEHSQRIVADLASPARGFVVIDETSFRYAGVFDVELYPIRDAIDKEAYARVFQARLLAGHEKEFPLVRAEDLILIKLREYERVLDFKHIDDIRKLLVARREDLDVEYLESRIQRHGFERLWKKRIEGATGETG